MGILRKRTGEPLHGVLGFEVYIPIPQAIARNRVARARECARTYVLAHMDVLHGFARVCPGATMDACARAFAHKPVGAGAVRRCVRVRLRQEVRMR